VISSVNVDVGQPFLRRLQARNRPSAQKDRNARKQTNYLLQFTQLPGDAIALLDTEKRMLKQTKLEKQQKPFTIIE
jgi:hypothetical protein